MTLPAPALSASGARPKIKICGLTTPEDAALAVELGAEYLGLNFYPPSPRYVDAATARQIADAVRGRAKLVGVFVNRPSDEIDAIVDEAGLDLVQFHGDETADDIRPYAARAIKVFRIAGDIDLHAFGKYGSEYHEMWGGLIDYRHPKLYGGSGESWNFASLARLNELPETSRPRRLFIAGGLRPGNVRAAIQAAHPYGIDLCSGVESTPGRKDPALLRQLFEEVEDDPQSQPA